MKVIRYIVLLTLLFQNTPKTECSFLESLSQSDNSYFVPALVVGGLATAVVGGEFLAKRYNNSQVNAELSQKVTKLNMESIQLQTASNIINNPQNSETEIAKTYNQLDYRNAKNQLAELPTFKEPQKIIAPKIEVVEKKGWFSGLRSFFKNKLTIKETDPRKQALFDLKDKINNYNNDFNNKIKLIKDYSQMARLNNDFYGLYSKHTNSVATFVNENNKASNNLNYPLLYNQQQQPQKDESLVLSNGVTNQLLNELDCCYDTYPYVEGAEKFNNEIDRVNNALYGNPRVIDHTFPKNPAQSTIIEKIKEGLNYFNRMLLGLKSNHIYSKQLEAFDKEKQIKEQLELEKRRVQAEEEKVRLERKIAESQIKKDREERLLAESKNEALREKHGLGIQWSGFFS
ncbi:MAG: hypothetical protein WDZ41_02470 [Candidatus Babeliales bacterium]